MKMSTNKRSEISFTNLKPKKRSKLRLFLGRTFYTSRKFLSYYFTKKRFTKHFDATPYPHLVFTHQTFLLRELKDVEMQLQYNKIINLKLAVKRLNGIVIKPNETFSYWKLIGKPTKRKGYVDGMVLFNGRFKSGIGGGLCQLSNLIYWMTLHTPLTVTERYRHSYDVFPDANRTQPFGSGATCAYNFLDLQIKNETNISYQLLLRVEEEYLVGEFRALTTPLLKFEVYEKDHAITPTYWGGYIRSNTIYRNVLNHQGEKIRDEYVTENHAIMMYEPLIEHVSK